MFVNTKLCKLNLKNKNLKDTKILNMQKINIEKHI